MCLPQKCSYLVQLSHNKHYRSYPLILSCKKCLSHDSICQNKSFATFTTFTVFGCCVKGETVTSAMGRDTVNPKKKLLNFQGPKNER